MSGLYLATLIRIELSVPGSYLFKGDSIKYLQVITAHGLIMVFFVVTPVLFGFLGNFFIPYHIGSKDVSFPRLNSLGFWVLFSGYFMLSKLFAFRKQIYKQYDNFNYYYNNYTKYDININNNKPTQTILKNYYNINSSININKLNDFNSLWYNYYNNSSFFLEKNNFNTICSNATYTVSGWTFITPFSSKTKFTGLGSQDMAVIAVIFSGISTTLSFVNLLITRRTLSMPGIRNRKVLIPFISINLFLTMRMLSLIVPVLAAGMIMLELDRHFGFSFFDYSYGGDPILFHHLF